MVYDNKIENKIHNFRKELSEKSENKKIDKFQKCDLWNNFVDSLKGESIYKFEVVMIKHENNTTTLLSKIYITKKSVSLPDINFRIGNLLFDQAKNYLYNSYLDKEKDLRFLILFLKKKYKKIHDEIFIEKIGDE